MRDKRILSFVLININWRLARIGLATLVGLALVILQGIVLVKANETKTPIAKPLHQATDETVIYVDWNAPGPGHDGLSWTTAYTDVQAALSAASSGKEIWVAGGVYYPAPDASDRTLSFQLKQGVALYGGFAATETLRSQRDWAANPTVLSGDLGRDDTTDGDKVVTDTANIVGSNAYHVVISSGVTETAVLDGFILTAGKANGSSPLDQGGGLYNSNANPILANLILSANVADNYGSRGGGMYTTGGSPSLLRVTFNANRATGLSSTGGGMYIHGGSPSLEDVRFEGNLTYDGSGGGIYNDNSSPSLVDVVFRGNQAGNYGSGGGMYTSGGNPSLTNVLFSGNRAYYGGGLHSYSGNPVLNGVTAASNYNHDSFACISVSWDAITMVNSIVWGNRGAELEGSINVSYSIVEGGYSGVGNLDADPLFVSPADYSLTPTTAGNYRLRYGSPAIDAGNTLSVTVTTDLDGATRVVDGNGDSSALVDMGAYEFQRYLLTIGKIGMGQVSVDPLLPAWTYNDRVVLTAQPETGWLFDGWSGDWISTTNPLTLTIQGSASITATFSSLSYSLDVTHVGEGTVSKMPDKPSYQYGEVVTLTAQAEPHWFFNGWSGDIISSTNPLTLTILGSTALTATFSQVEYGLDIDLVGNGSVIKEPDESTYHHGDEVTLTAQAEAHWFFDGWTGDVISSANPMTLTVQGSTTLTATFSQAEYSLDIVLVGDGNIVSQTPDQPSYHYGDVVTVTVSPEPGWFFVGWSGDATGSALTIQIPINGDMTVNAIFDTNRVYLPLIVQ